MSLFDVPRSKRYRGTKAIVHVPRSARRCKRCDLARLFEFRVRQSALFWSHGYGATNQTTLLLCGSCGAVSRIETAEVAPDRTEKGAKRRG